MNSEKENARVIVEGILKEIEQRASTVRTDPAAMGPLADRLRQLEEDIGRECVGDVPESIKSGIRKKLGKDLMEMLERGKLGSLVFKNSERINRLYRKLAVLIAQNRLSLHEICRLRQIQAEMVESQIAHVQEVEIFEKIVQRGQLLIDLVLQPFEEAMRRVMEFLEARQIEIYLFDDDRFLSSELKTDGKNFVYHKDEVEERPRLPSAVNEFTYQEVQEIFSEVPLIVEGLQIGHYLIRPQITEDFDKQRWMKRVEFITPVAAHIIQANHNSLQAQKVYTDDLTQLYNKRKLNEQMGRLFKQFKTGQKQLFIAMMDIDRFKKLNDTYGHPVGDEVLKQTALIIKDCVPYAYRYGGEEFCAVFYGFEKDGVIEAMEALRRRVEETPYLISGMEYRITLSAGIAEFDTSMNAVMDAIDLADQALYISKQDGRNRCTYYDDVKDRLSVDHLRTRQENVRLNEENVQLKEELTRLREAMTDKKPSRGR